MRTITNDDIREAYKRGKANDSLAQGFYVVPIFGDDGLTVIEEKHCIIGECLTEEERKEVFMHANYLALCYLDGFINFEDWIFAKRAQSLFDCGKDKELREHLGL